MHTRKQWPERAGCGSDSESEAVFVNNAALPVGKRDAHRELQIGPPACERLVGSLQPFLLPLDGWMRPDGRARVEFEKGIADRDATLARIAALLNRDQRRRAGV